MKRRVPLRLLVLLALAFVLRVRNAWTPLEALSRTTLPDDAFYDFGIARNLAHGLPPSIDGLHPTNGYHPLWVALLTIVYRIWPEDLRTPVHVALTLGALFDVAALWFVHRIARRLRLSVGADLAVLALAVSAGAIVHATCGLETPLALLLLLAVVDRQLARPDTTRELLRFGLLAGLAMLARTDAAIPCAAMTIAVVRAQRARLRALLLVSAASAACLLPWFLYSYRTTGTVVQSSAIALALVADRMPRLWGYEHVPATLRIGRAIASCAEAYCDVARFTGLGVLGLTFVLGGAVAVVVTARRRRRAWMRAVVGRAVPFVAGLLLLFVLHTVVRKVFRGWYTAPYVVLTALAIGFAVEHLARGARWISAAAAGALVVALAIDGSEWQRKGIYAGGNYAAIVPAPGLYEGHTDCGAVAYFSRRGVVNLDGVVNESAVVALREGRLLEYVRKERVQRVYATDHFHDAIFFGPRYRESLRAVPEDPRAVRIATLDEKGALVTLGREPISLGSLAGRELLDDGWLWMASPPARGAATSLGAHSELLVVVPAPLPPSAKIELTLRAPWGLQHVLVRLDDRPPATVTVTASPTIASLPLDGESPGRHRVHLDYPDAVPVRELGSAGWFAWWRSLRGNALHAVEADSIRLVRASDVRLPPEGPPLADAAADALFSQGFMPVERDGPAPGVWAIGHDAEVTFWTDRTGDRALALRVGPPPAGPEGDAQTITVSLNGTALGTFDVRPGPLARKVLRTGEALTVGVNHLTFHFARVQGGPFARAAYFGGLELE